MPELIGAMAIVLPAFGTMPAMEDALREATQVKNIWVPYGG